MHTFMYFEDFPITPTQLHELMVGFARHLWNQPVGIDENGFIGFDIEKWAPVELAGPWGLIKAGLVDYVIYEHEPTCVYFTRTLELAKWLMEQEGGDTSETDTEGKQPPDDSASDAAKPQDKGIEVGTVNPRRAWLKSGSPPKDWHQTPLVGQMQQFADWLGTSTTTLRSNNGKTHWITAHIGCDPETNWPARFAIYFETSAKFATVNVKRIMEADKYLKQQREANSQSPPKEAKGSERKQKEAVPKKGRKT